MSLITTVRDGRARPSLEPRAFEPHRFLVRREYDSRENIQPYLDRQALSTVDNASAGLVENFNLNATVHDTS